MRMQCPVCKKFKGRLARCACGRLCCNECSFLHMCIDCAADAYHVPRGAGT